MFTSDSSTMHEINAVAAIAGRDLVKFLRDRSRVVLSFLVPLLLLVLLGKTVQSNLGHSAGFNFVAFTFTGVLGMTIFQSSMQGIASLLDDRQNDFAQEIFIAPISRYTIVCGKILGESLVALAQTLPVLAMALLLGVSISPGRLALLAPVAVAGCVLGGSFGLVAMALINTRRAADQMFNFLLLPQLFLAGVFNPITVLPWYLAILSRLSPLRYLVDLFRDVMYAGRPEYSRVVLLSPAANVVAIIVMVIVFVSAGTALFVRRETNR
jgi:ABC-2 type transport system permease protein